VAGSSGHHTSDPHRFIESDSLCVEITVEEVPYASNVIAAEATQASAAPLLRPLSRLGAAIQLRASTPEHHDLWNSRHDPT
jgi:hypothetical protein